MSSSIFSSSWRLRASARLAKANRMSSCLFSRSSSASRRPLYASPADVSESMLSFAASIRVVSANVRNGGQPASNSWAISFSSTPTPPARPVSSSS